MTSQTKRAGTFMVALGGMVAMFALLVASPAAHAQTSGGAIATGGSVASGTADADNNSTASGDATARNNSTASGCATAVNNSTASGDDCRPATGVTTTTARPPTTTGGGTTATTAGATAARLALTGSWTAPLMAFAALAIAMGMLLQTAGSTGRRPVRG